MTSEPTNQQIADIVKAYLPRRWRLDEWTREDAEADFLAKTIRCPDIVDKWTLGYFLHEAGHVLLRHRCEKTGQRHLPRHVEEHQAELFSWHTLQAWGMKPSSLYRWNSRVYVGSVILEDEALAVPVDPKIRAWARFAKEQ